MTAFTSEASGALGGPDWLVARRRAVGERLGSLALPSEAEEIWRYSGIDRFDLDAFAPLPPTLGRSTTDGALDEARRWADALGPRAALVVTRDGVVAAVEPGPDAPADLVRVVGAGPLAASGAATAPEDLGWEHDAPEDGDAFGTLHAALVADVVLVTVTGRRVVDAPVVIVHVAGVSGRPNGAPPAPAVFPHTVVRLGQSAQAGVVEMLVSPAGAPGTEPLVVPVTELDLADDAQLAYANLQLLGPGAVQIGHQTSRVGRDGALRSLTVGLGGAYARVRTDSDLVGQGGRSTLLAAYLGIGRQVHDFRTLQDHHAPRTDSELLFTGAVADTSRSVYSGLIRIRRGARRSDARQTNNNLVLSEGAHADSVPNLDIDENDVRCSHASTVGPIDEEQRYYLESRGVEPALAERLIVRGFFADLAGRSPFAEVNRWVTSAVEERLAGRLPAERGGDGEDADAVAAGTGSGQGGTGRG